MDESIGLPLLCVRVAECDAGLYGVSGFRYEEIDFSVLVVEVQFVSVDSVQMDGTEVLEQRGDSIAQEDAQKAVVLKLKVSVIQVDVSDKFLSFTYQCPECLDSLNKNENGQIFILAVKISARRSCRIQ